MKSKANVFAKILGTMYFAAITILAGFIGWSLYKSYNESGWGVLVFIMLFVPALVVLALFLINLVFYIMLLRGKRSVVYIIFNLLAMIAALVGGFFAESEALILFAYSIYLLIFSIILIIDRSKFIKAKKEMEH